MKKILIIIILLFVTFSIIGNEIFCYYLNKKLKFCFVGEFEIIKYKGIIYENKVGNSKNTLIINGFIVLSNGPILKAYYIIINEVIPEKKKDKKKILDNKNKG